MPDGGARRPRVAVLGTGHLGRHHARILASLDAAELVAVHDVDPAAGRAVAESVGAPFAPRLEDLDARHLDAVSIAAPTRAHHALARRFLERGVAVLVEKPMTSTLDQAEDLVALAREKRVTLMVGHVERFNPAVVSVLRMGLRPRYVEAQRIGPYSFRSGDIGVVHDLMIHDLDIVLQLVPSELLRVDAVGVPVLTPREDIANARLVFEDGAVASLTASRVSMKVQRTMRMFAPEGYISLDYGKRTGVVYRKRAGFDEAVLALRDKLPGEISDKTAAVFGELLEVEALDLPEDAEDGGGEPLRAELSAFVDAVSRRTEPPVPGEHGVRAMRAAAKVLEAIEASLARLR
jgi:predicted dehydrogenase